jgi:Firmicute plasmid replication protein (RepL)
MSQQTRRGIELHQENPFIPNIIANSRRVTNKRGDMSLINNNTGEVVTSVAGFYEVKEVDSSKFLKLFVNGVKALAGLSNAGCKVFELMYMEVQENIGKDYVYLSFTGLNKHEIQLSERTFRRGLSELIEKRFIAAMPGVGLYWINPDFIWNGDRLAFVQEYYKTDNLTPSKKQKSLTPPKDV